MNIKFQEASRDGVNDNKGSCRKLAEYCEHEDIDRQKHGKEVFPFTDQNGNATEIEDVISGIDGNHSHLGKNDSKFYHLVVAPSKDEINAMGQCEKEIYASALRYIKQISDAYAANFNKSGITDADNIQVFWKPHFTRGTDDTLQFHLHAIIARNSRPDSSGKSVKLSPMTNHRHTEDGAVKGGFDRKNFAERAEEIFDILFAHEREICESFEYLNIQKHGSAEKKAEVAMEIAQEEARRRKIKEKILARLEKSKRDKTNIVSNETPYLPSAHISDTSDLNHAVAQAELIQQICTIVLSPSDDLLTKKIRLATLGITIENSVTDDGALRTININQNGQTFDFIKCIDTTTAQYVLDIWARQNGLTPEYQLLARKEADTQRKSIQPKLKIKR